VDDESLSSVLTGLAMGAAHKLRAALCALGRSVRAYGVRSIFHLTVLAVIGLSLSLSGLRTLPFSVSVNLTPPTAAPTAVPHVVAASPVTVRGAQRSLVEPPSAAPAAPVGAAIVQSLVLAPVPHTIVPDRPRKGVVTYTVQAGDNVFGIADRFGLRHETVVWSNKELETDPDMLYIGQELIVLPVDGVYHVVAEGETLEQIATQYKVEVEAIAKCEFNGLLPGDPLVAGQELIVPGGVKPFRPHYVQFEPVEIPADALRGSGNFVWPVGGYISQGYWNLHRAIDIAGPEEDPVVAADDGVVVYAAWGPGGYGNLVVIDHGNGFMSYYGHLYGFYVDAGQQVQRGQAIGVRGNTGRSTGPHLHFEIRQNGVQRNPIGLLPKQ
jgi:murein DD-endopeptidase MepM/ murein hydrolase activator NlpD